MTELQDMELPADVSTKLKKLFEQAHQLEKFAKKYNQVVSDIKKLIPDTPNTRYQVGDTEITVVEHTRKEYVVPAKKVIQKKFKRNIETF